MKGGRRVYATLALVAIGGSGLYWQNGREEANAARSVARASAPLPSLGMAKDLAEAITKIELTRPEADDEEPSHSRTITLEKQDRRWEVTSPVKTRASASNVAALIENLRELRITDTIDPGTGPYDPYELEDDKAIHVAAWSGDAKVCDLYFGRTDPRGRSVRIAGQGGVFAVANSGPGGFSGFLYTRGLRGWRETSILQFAEDEAIHVEITNRNGRFSFSRNGGGWSGSLAERDRRGNLGEPKEEWPKFDGSKVDDLLRAYRSLSADDFGDEQQMAGSGVDRAEHTGGVVRVSLKGGAGDRTIRVGKISTNTGRWAIKNSRWAIDEQGDGTLYALAPWTADWATADASVFESAAAAR